MTKANVKESKEIFSNTVAYGSINWFKLSGKQYGNRLKAFQIFRVSHSVVLFLQQSILREIHKSTGKCLCTESPIGALQITAKLRSNISTHH